MKWEESARYDCWQECWCAEDVIDLGVTAVVCWWYGGVWVMVFVDVEKVVLGGEVFPRVLALGIVEACVGID